MNPASPDPTGENGPTHAGESHRLFQCHRLRLAAALRAPDEPSANSLDDKKLIPLHGDFRDARRGLGLCFQLALCLGTLLP